MTNLTDLRPFSAQVTLAPSHGYFDTRCTDQGDTGSDHGCGVATPDRIAMRRCATVSRSLTANCKNRGKNPSN